MSGNRAIKVIVRERPAHGGEGKLLPPSLTLDEHALTAESYLADSGKTAKIRLDGCFGPGRSQAEVWDGVLGVLEEVQQGKSATILAYGVTGSGKTHTMQGTPDDPGLMYRAVESVFELPDLRRVNMSLVEILNDQVYDLLSGSHAKLDIRSDGYSNFMPLMTVEPVKSVDHFEELFADGAKQRATAATKLNAQSSRSHSLLMLDLEFEDTITGIPIRAKLRPCSQLVDLAGSENNNRTGNDKTRLRESSAINQSLTSLGNVIDAINQGGKPVFRESKLTRLLSDVLGGESKGIMICCMAPGSNFAKDTYNTLCFAQRASGLKARSVTTQPRVSMAPRAPIRAIGARSRPQQAPKVLKDSSVPSRAIARQPLRAVPNGIVPSTKTADYVSKSDVERMLEPLLHQNAQLATQLAEMGNANAEASKRLEEALAQIPVQPALTDDENAAFARACVREARIAQESEDYTRAIALLRRAQTHQPDKERIQQRIADIQLRMDTTLPRPKGVLKRQRELDSMPVLSALEVESPFKRIRFAE